MRKKFQKIKFRKSWKNYFENGISENSNFEEWFEDEKLFWKIIWKRKFWKLKFWKLNFEEWFENGIFFKKNLNQNFGKLFKKWSFKIFKFGNWNFGKLLKIKFKNENFGKMNFDIKKNGELKWKCGLHMRERELEPV